MTDVADPLAWTDLPPGSARSFSFAVSDDDMAAFARLSGDVNPVHTDDATARRRGLDGRVVYGGLLLAKVSKMIGMHLPGRDALWLGVDMQFRKPLMVDQPATLSATVTNQSEATRTLDIALRIESDGKTIASGTALVRVQGDDA